MRPALLVFACSLFCCCLAKPSGDTTSGAADVILLANARDPESLELARHYCRARGVPEENIAILPMSGAETVDWATFVREVYNPLLDWLTSRGWVDAGVSALTDELGRRRTAPFGHRVGHLVLLRGVPLRISGGAGGIEKSNTALPERLRTDRASVDAELALLASAPGAVVGPLPNPLFRVKQPGDLALGGVIRVARIDGPSLDACIWMVDTSISVEQNRLAGRAYVDSGGPHAVGDRWLAAVAEQLRAMDFEVSVHAARGVMDASVVAEDAALYFGWYSGSITGPFLEPDFRFAPGAIAVHIHSFSAGTLRSETEGWAGPLVARGAAATVGNVYEPYLEFSHRPDLLLEALAEGRSWGEAGCYALPVLSWQAVLIGDPLYRPFPKPSGD